MKYGSAVIVLLGHSYVRRLSEYQLRNASCRNLGFSTSAVELHAFCRGGVSTRHGTNERSMFTFIRQVAAVNPDIVYLHVGENDLVDMSPSALINAVKTFINYFLSRCRLIISNTESTDVVS